MGALDGIGNGVLGVVLELLVRLGIYVGFLNKGGEWFALVSLLIIGITMILFSSILLWIKL